MFHTHTHTHTLGAASCCRKLGSVSGSAVTSLRPWYAKKGPSPASVPARFARGSRDPQSVPPLALVRAGAGRRAVCGGTAEHLPPRPVSAGAKRTTPSSRTEGREDRCGGNQDAQEDVVTPRVPLPPAVRYPDLTLPLFGEPSGEPLRLRAPSPRGPYRRRCKLLLARPARVPDPLPSAAQC